ncbi:MAG: cytochrome c [Betaproteobacteria bacterium]
MNTAILRSGSVRLRNGVGGAALALCSWLAMMGVGAGQPETVAGPQPHEASVAVASYTPPSDTEIARGAYLARLGDCAACHSVPAKPDYSGGLPMRSPLGVIISTNITPDRETGIGSYTLQDFDRALRQGRTPRHNLYPAMPYAAFTKVTDNDIAALYAYFMHGVKPVHRKPPPTDLPFPFNQRWGLALWNGLFVEHGTYQPDSGKSAQWNRGAYLVQGLGHCGSCHTPRGVAYQPLGFSETSRHFLAGGITDHWLAPNLTGQRESGLADWSAEQISQFLKSGQTVRNMVFGPMRQVVSDSSRHFDDADLASIATYLKSLGPRHRDASFLPATAPRHTVAWLQSGDVRIPGGGLYANFCAKCHQAGGEGDPTKAPALVRSGVVRSPDPSSVIHILISGGNQHPASDIPAMAGIDPMPAFAKQFSDREIAEVASFVRRSWGNDAAPVTERQVQKIRAAAAAETH